MKINFKVRLKNKIFWTTLIPSVILLITQVCQMFGVELNLTQLSTNLVNIVSTAFIVLSILGIVNDPTTSGLSDSTNAMTYTEPKK